MFTLAPSRSDIRQLASLFQVALVAMVLVGCMPGQTSTAGNDPDAGSGDARWESSNCDPVLQTGCQSGEKCGALVQSANPRLVTTSCVPAGTRLEGESCERGPEGDQGYDDCAPGLSCLDSVCATICSRDPEDSCRNASEASGAGSYCTVFADLFDESTGLCVPGCDPADDNACDEGYGCYMDAERGVAACALVPPAASDLAQNSDCYGPASGHCYLNGCSAGHTPLLSNKTSDADASLCARYCTPEQSFQGSDQAVTGIHGQCESFALSQSGGTNGNNSPHQCRFVQTFYDNTEGLPASLGMCVPVHPLSGGSWGDCSDFDWVGIRSRWDAAILEGSDPVAAFRNHCLESPADPNNSPVLDRCIGLFRGCVSLSEAEQVLDIPAGGARFAQQTWISSLGVTRPSLQSLAPRAWRSQD